MVAVEYYHRPITVKEDCRPLQGLTIVFSTYTTPERDFLAYLAEALGSEVNDRYMRNQNPILVCPTAEGKKYLGAIKWGKYQSEQKSFPVPFPCRQKNLKKNRF